MRKGKQQFELRAKRLGLDDAKAASAASSYLRKLRNVPFWQENNPNCFWDLVGRPTKNDIPRPLYNYQKPIIDSLESGDHLLCINKGRNVGLSELLIRWSAWRATRDNSWANGTVIYLTGPRQATATTLISRLKGLFPNMKQDTKETVAMINNVKFESYPSTHALQSVRGITNVRAIICDEFEYFFSDLDSEALIPTILPHWHKSGAYIILLSTPSHVASLMWKILKEPMNKTLWKRFYIPYTLPLQEGFFTQQEVNALQSDPNINFEVEYNCQFGSYGGQSAYFTAADLEHSQSVALSYEKIIQNQYQGRKSYPHSLLSEGKSVIGLDLGFSASGSQSAVVCCQIYNQYIHVQTAKAYRHGTTQDQIINDVVHLWLSTQRLQRGGGGANIFVDMALPSFIQALKQQIRKFVPSERIDYINQLQYLRQHGWSGDQDDSNLPSQMVVTPVPFNKWGNIMLSRLIGFVQRGILLIHPDFSELLDSLASARPALSATQPYTLSKETMTMDLVDAMRLCFRSIPLTPTTHVR